VVNAFRLGREGTAMQAGDRHARKGRSASGDTSREDGSNHALTEPSPAATNLERRRGPGRRLTDFVRSAEDGEMDREQFLFLLAIDEFKRVNGKAFPNWTDVLEVVRKLGYRKTMPSTINLRGRAQDWRERADAPVSKQVADAPPRCEAA